MTKLLFYTSASLAITKIASAHASGHTGGFAEIANHFISHPSHWLPVAACGMISVGAVLAIKFRRKSARQRVTTKQ